MAVGRRRDEWRTKYDQRKGKIMNEPINRVNENSSMKTPVKPSCTTITNRSQVRQVKSLSLSSPSPTYSLLLLTVPSITKVQWFFCLVNGIIEWREWKVVSEERTLLSFHSIKSASQEQRTTLGNLVEHREGTVSWVLWREIRHAFTPFICPCHFSSLKPKQPYHQPAN